MVPAKPWLSVEGDAVTTGSGICDPKTAGISPLLCVGVTGPLLCFLTMAHLLSVEGLVPQGYEVHRLHDLAAHHVDDDVFVPFALLLHRPPGPGFLGHPEDGVCRLYDAAIDVLVAWTALRGDHFAR